MKIETIVKVDPEYGYTIRYLVEDNLINWEVFDESEVPLMKGTFISTDFFRSTFTTLLQNMNENVYENLFYLYFENIKLDCIALVEGTDYEEEGEIS